MKASAELANRSAEAWLLAASASLNLNNQKKNPTKIVGCLNPTQADPRAMRFTTTRFNQHHNDGAPKMVLHSA